MTQPVLIPSSHSKPEPYYSTVSRSYCNFVYCVFFFPLLVNYPHDEGKVKSLSRVQLFVTPWTVCSPPGSSVHDWSGLPFPSPGDLPNQGIEPRSPALRADALTSEPPGKPKHTGVGCHSLLQEIFPTQGLNPGLPHYRQTLYYLSHQRGSINGSFFRISQVSSCIRPYEDFHGLCGLSW